MGLRRLLKFLLLILFAMYICWSKRDFLLLSGIHCHWRKMFTLWATKKLSEKNVRPLKISVKIRSQTEVLLVSAFSEKCEITSPHCQEKLWLEKLEDQAEDLFSLPSLPTSLNKQFLSAEIWIIIKNVNNPLAQTLLFQWQLEMLLLCPALAPQSVYLLG